MIFSKDKYPISTILYMVSQFVYNKMDQIRYSYLRNKNNIITN